MPLRGIEINLHDMCLRDGMHARRHRIPLSEMRELACALDEAGVPMIEVSHGDGLGGSSVNYGFSTHNSDEYLPGGGDSADEIRKDIGVAAAGDRNDG